MSTAPDRARPADGGPDAARTDRLLRRANRAIGAAFLLAAGAVLATNLAGAGKAKCGIDWLLAVCGSDATCESLFRDALQRSQDDFEAEHADRFRPAFGDLDKPLDFDKPLEFELPTFTGFDAAGPNLTR